MALIDLTPPTTEPLDLAYVKTFLRVDTDDDDTLIVSLIKTARCHVENRIGRALIHRTFVYRGPLPSGNTLTLPMPPLVSISALRVYDDDNNFAVVGGENYAINTHDDPGRLRLKNGELWSAFLTGAAYIDIEFTAGYGAAPDDVPLPIRQAILLLVTQYYESRGMDDGAAVPALVDGLLAPYRWVRI